MMCGKKKYIEMFGSFMEPFSCNTSGSRVTGFTSDFLSFVVMEHIRFFHRALQMSVNTGKKFEQSFFYFTIYFFTAIVIK